ncbi:MAG TPA: ABC transporter substrate-binding protein [Thermomicrobiales bacterium]|nr:ABC transporter substrate-binding protein [Thermomicrobiales bacterium]
MIEAAGGLGVGALASRLPIGRAAAQDDLSLTLKYGVLVGLTGDAAPAGQAWNEAVSLGIDVLNEKLAAAGLGDRLKAVLTDAQDSEGTAQRGVEAATKLVTVDQVQVVIGDLFSSVTSAAAQSVVIPNNVLMFTGGTNPALTQLNGSGPTLLWQPVAADDLQGRVLAQIMGEAFSADADVNAGVRNDAYGTGLGEVFRGAWEKGGGTIGEYVTINPDQPTYDTEAQQLVNGDPAGWLMVDFCPEFAKLVGPLQRSGKWDPTKTFGSDTMIDCGAEIKEAGVPGMRAVQANASSGSSFKDYQQLFQSKASNLNFQAFTAEAFDSVFIAFLAAVAAKSDDPVEISKQVVAVTNPPGDDYTYLDIDKAVQALLAGKDIHFNGATGPILFNEQGRVTSTAYDIWQVGDDGRGKVVDTIEFKA